MTDLQPQWLKQQLAAIVPAGQVMSGKDAHLETGGHMLQLLAVCARPLGEACSMSWDTMALASPISAPAITLSWIGFAHVNLHSCTGMCQAIGIESLHGPCQNVDPGMTRALTVLTVDNSQCCRNQESRRAMPATASSDAMSGCSL